MTSRDEAMRRRLAPALATADREYRASSGEVPIELLAPLFAAILTFGVFLTAFVPFGYVRLQRNWGADRSCRRFGSSHWRGSAFLYCCGGAPFKRWRSSSIAN